MTGHENKQLNVEEKTTNTIWRVKHRFWKHTVGIIPILKTKECFKLLQNMAKISVFLSLPNNMISSFLRSTRNLSSVHSGSGKAWGPLKSSSDPGTGESVLRSLFEPWSDCCKYPLRESHWVAIALHSNVSNGHCVSKKKVNYHVVDCKTYFPLFIYHFEILSRLIVAHWLLPRPFPRAPLFSPLSGGLLSLEHK